MAKNFNHQEPKRVWWTQVVSGDEVANPITQQTLDKYLELLLLDKSKFQVDIDLFTQDYGVYYSEPSRTYMNIWGRIYENGDAEAAKWNLPKMVDFRQLAAMSPFNTKSDPTHEDLNERDVRFALGPRSDANPMSGIVVTGQCGSTYWFGNQNDNQYGFNLMPNGARLNGTSSWTTNLCTVGNVNNYGVQGDIYHLFYTAKLAAQDGGFSLHDQVDTKYEYSYHWMNVRWCRRLSDEELGYKLYIKVENLAETSNEWKSLQNGNEIPLLLTMRQGNLTPAQTSIIKIGLMDTYPEGYTELPNGYIRGFYVQHVLNTPSSPATIHKVMQYAYSVQDGVLGFNIGASSNPIAVYPENTLRLSTVEFGSNIADNTICVYPNPVTDILYLDSPEAILDVCIYSITGKMVLQQTNIGSSVNVNHLPSGTYILKLQRGDESYTHKIIKK